MGRLDISFAIVTASTGPIPRCDFAPWEFVIDRRRFARQGKGITERLIGSIRPECLDHVVILGERHPRHVLASYMSYDNATGTHLPLRKDFQFRGH